MKKIPSSNKKIKRIHMTGICGIAMGTLAGMLKDIGFDVTGSDSNVDPPMSDILKENNIKVYEGFSESNLKNIDMVIIGNAISRGNSEVEHILNNNIPYISMAQALYSFFLKDKEVISVSGTHGKSTTTALLAHILETAGESPSFFIGGVAKNYNSNYKLGKGKYFIIEGDEYDSAFFEKVPKFIFYRPNHLIITSLEFDHADIFKDIDEIELWFKRLVNIIPSNGNIVFSNEYKRIKKVLDGSLSRKYSYGNSGSDVNYNFSGYNDEYALSSIDSSFFNLNTESKLFGDFNYSNIAGASSMASLLGISSEHIFEGIKNFQGVKRRQDLIYKKDGILVYEDFAHHPTSIKYILDTMRHRYPKSKIWAVYEPRSATSRRNILKDKLYEAFNSADHILIKTPYKLDSINENERLNADELITKLNAKNKTANLFKEVNQIIKFIEDEISPDIENVIVVMSNGGFDGIYSKMIEMLNSIF